MGRQNPVPLPRFVPTLDDYRRWRQNKNIKNDVAHSLFHIIKYVKTLFCRELNSRENGIIYGNYRIYYISK